MGDGEKVSQLIRAVELDIAGGNYKEAEHRLFQAWEIAKETQDLALTSAITSLCRKVGLFVIATQSVEPRPLKTEGLILDIGGGGEGIIGRLNGARVVAIDTSERELAETRNAALKIVMDAADLKFLPDSFDVCTAFFSLMYIPKSKHSKVFEEAYRVLKDNGQFLVWDVRIPSVQEEYRQFIVPLKVELPGETVETGYGVKWQTQDLGYFKELAKEHGFKIADDWSKGEILYLKMLKAH